MKEVTKKLQKLVKNRKTHVVVIKRGSVKYNSGSSSSEDGYSSDGYENN
jgi:hypothetical protein